MSNVALGLEVALRRRPEVLKGKRIGLLMNQASVDRHFRYAHDLFAAHFEEQLTALFSPQHGFWAEQQANMIETPHQRDPKLDVPIYSLYSHTRRPTDEMLQQIDVLVIDLQDVGTRVYTFVWTMVHCLQACAAAGLPVVILDRPNPISGNVFEGPLLDDRYTSFVGLAEIPLRHGLTIGELALAVNQWLEIHADLHIVRMEGWQRSMLLPDMMHAWIVPSPNLPTFASALVYPGQVLLEGTNLSEGRGTTTPFELVGAPFLDADALADQLNRVHLPGVAFRPIRFTPTFDKWQGQSCGGVFLHVTAPHQYRPVLTTLHLLHAIWQRWPAQAQWLDPPYEYEQQKMPIDILFGSDRLRDALASARPLSDETIEKLAATDSSTWLAKTEGFHLY